MFTVKTENFELEIKSRKVALDIRDQLRKQEVEAKVIQIKEIE